MRNSDESELDRKSSRGMIYENEELRLRTININAEVERGQSDIKRLRRENEQLRREIWTLRDECDRLNKRFKAKLADHDHGNCNVRGSGGSGGACHPRGSGGPCDSNSEDSDSCETCRANDDQCSDEYCTDPSCSQAQSKKQVDSAAGSSFKHPSNVYVTEPDGEVQQLHPTFDHLSVVSEETLSNNDMSTLQSDSLLGFTPDINGSQTTLPSLVGPLTPLTPIELVANQLNDLQAMVPPLSYFENVLQQHMNSSMGNSTESAHVPGTRRIMKHTNGWDYNLQSPFAPRKSQPTNTTTANAMPASTSVKQQRFPAPTLTTFVPANAAQPVTITNVNALNQKTNSTAPPHAQQPPGTRTDEAPIIETVAITTMPANSTPTLNSPKHFFSPLKPRLRINTSLANTQIQPQSPTFMATVAAGKPSNTTPTKVGDSVGPPDLYVANGLASPYQRPKEPPPPLPQRSTTSSSPQVSPHKCSHSNQQQQLQHHHASEANVEQKPLQRTTLVVTVARVVSDTDDDDDNDAVDDGKGEIVYNGCNIANADANTSTDASFNKNSDCVQQQSISLPTIEISSSKTIETTTTTTTTVSSQKYNDNLLTSSRELEPEKANILLAKLNEPIYATAKKCSNNTVSATSLTQPLMTAAEDLPTPMNKHKENSNHNGHLQSNSLNLDSILNDINTISEDILAIQKGKDNASATENRSLQDNDKNKKPYRSQMNLQLTYDGTSSTIATTTANKTAMATQTSLTNESGTNERRARSLEREHTDSPPDIPDPMAPFPDNRTYIGFDQLNKAANTAMKSSADSSPQKTSQSTATPLATVTRVGSKPNLAAKPPPPTPPARVYPPPLNLRPPIPGKNAVLGQSFPPASPVHGLSPNKSHLYSSIANAAAKRALFRSTSGHGQAAKSLDPADLLVQSRGATTPQGSLESPRIEIDDSAINADAEALKRKARRVSIVCGDTSSPGTPDFSPGHAPARSTAQLNTSANSNPNSKLTVSTITTTASNSSTGSCIDLPSTLATPTINLLKQTSHSTPNSPHSSRRRCNSNIMNVNHTSIDMARTSPASSPYHQHTIAQQQQLMNAIANGQGRKSSQESTQGNSTELTTVVAARSKCSRRHSDGTVNSTANRVSGASGGHHHHHHQRHHHQHQHSNSAGAYNHNSHHGHHGRQDSNSNTSISDRNSSLASSRESSTNFSVRSQRRKISISSHTGGKIPWCGCWGNGCL